MPKLLLSRNYYKVLGYGTTLYVCSDTQRHLLLLTSYLKDLAADGVERDVRHPFLSSVV